MRERTARLAVGVLGVVCLGLVLSVVHPLTTASPQAANPAGDRFTVGDADAFSATGRIVVEGETVLAFEGAVAADGETGAVTAANVSQTVTRGETFAHYALSRVLYSGSTESRTTFAYDASPPSLERPAWATEGGTNATGTGDAC
jgi:hypothetical protein